MARRIVATSSVAFASILVVGYLIALVAFPEVVHFDGEIGSGCDAGNSLCTYKEWAKDCDGGPAMCSVAVYRQKGGK